MEDKDEMIAKVSDLYREKLKDKANIAAEMRGTKERLKDHSLPYAEYVRLQRSLDRLDQEHTILVYVTLGISLAREALFD